MKTKYNSQNITFVSWRLSYQIRSAFKQIWLSRDFKDANFHMKEYVARNSVIFYWKLHLQNEMATIILIMIIAAIHILNYVGDFVKCTSWIISFNPSVVFSSELTRALCCSVAKFNVTLWDPMDYSTTGFPVHHLPDFAQIHVHRVGDVIQPSHPLSSPSPPAFNLSQHEDLF